MKHYVLLLLVELIQFCNSDLTSEKNNFLSRKKRYLSFPIGSAAIINLSFSAVYVWDLTDSPRQPYNAVFEADLGFTLPNNTRFLYGSSGKNFLRRRERRELYHNIAGVLNIYGMDGHNCILRTLCEAKKYLKPGRSFVEDILHVIFTVPQGNDDEFEADGYEEATRMLSCKSLTESCPLPLLQYLLL